MKNNEIKNRVTDAFNSETPNIKNRVLQAIEKEEQESVAVISNRKSSLIKRLAVIVSFCLIFTVGLAVGNLFPLNTSVTAETVVYLDVNPSITLSLDKNDTILSATAVNSDAEIVLSGMDFKGVSLKTGLNAIIGSMYINGYLSMEDNSMLISVDKKDKSTADAYLTAITTSVNEIFASSNMKCSIITQSVEKNQDLIDRANDKGVSIGKIHFIDKVFDDIDEIIDDTEDMFNMSIKDLSLIFKNSPKYSDEDKKEVVSGEIEGVFDKNAIKEKVLQDVGVEEFDTFYVFAIPKRHGNERVVYLVRFTIDGDNTVYQYEISSKDGTIISRENPNQKPPQGDHNGDGNDPMTPPSYDPDGPEGDGPNGNGGHGGDYPHPDD